VDKRKEWCLLIRLGGIGDNIIASSVLPLLAKDYNVEVMAQKPWHVIFENNPFIDKLTVREEGDIPHANALEWQEWFVRRGKEYAKWVNLSHSCESQLAVFPSQSPFYWPAAWRRKHCGQSYLEFVHDVAEAPYDFDEGPRVYPTDEEKEKARTTLDKVRGAGGYKHVVGVCLSGSRLDKVWPYFPLLIAKLIRELHCAVVMFGTPEREREVAQTIQDFVHEYTGSYDGLHAAITAYEPDGKTLVADWPIRRALATLQMCDLVIGPDTGLMWGVAMQGLPKFMLHSHASVENIVKHWANTTSFHADPERVPCWPCHQLHDKPETCRKAANANAAACISDIAHEAVFAAVKTTLFGKGEDDGGRISVSGKGVARLVPHDSRPDEAGGLVGWPVAGRSIVNLG
jgi:ADP-heptose:LPS heptosyltransferase